MYSRRYAKFYDTVVAEVDVDKKGYVTYKEYMDFNTRHVGVKSAKEVCVMYESVILISLHCSC